MRTERSPSNSIRLAKLDQRLLEINNLDLCTALILEPNKLRISDSSISFLLNVRFVKLRNSSSD